MTMRNGNTYLLAVILSLCGFTSAQNFTVLHRFTGGPGGSEPLSTLTRDAAGNLYGTTSAGGLMTGVCSAVGGCGTVFQLSQKNDVWVYTLLYEFRGELDGQTPRAALTRGPDGALYGTTLNGGGMGCTFGYSCGVVFKLTPPGANCHSATCRWTESIVFAFPSASTGFGTPYGGIIFDEAGNIYGTEYTGGMGICQQACGAVYELTPRNGTWNLIQLYRFTGNDDGGSPMCTLLRDGQGNLYGTTSAGGQRQAGTVFELVRSGQLYHFKLLYSFEGLNDGGLPADGLIMDSAGVLYGDTPFYGANSGGTVFQLKPSGGGWNFAVLYNPNGTVSGPLTMDGAGNLFGTTASGGASSDGLVFELSRTGGIWTEQDVYSFNDTDGSLPYGGVTLDASGKIYGTTKAGGGANAGVAWQLTR